MHYDYADAPVNDALTATLGVPPWKGRGKGIDEMLAGQWYNPNHYPSRGLTTAKADWESYFGSGWVHIQTFRSKNDARVVNVVDWAAGGKAKYTVQVKGIPGTMCELELTNWLRQFGRICAMLLDRNAHDPSLCDGTCMVKYFSVRDVNRLLTTASNQGHWRYQGAEVPGHPASRIVAQPTMVCFVTPPRATRMACGWMERYQGGARYHHFKEFEKELMESDPWMRQPFQLCKSKMART